LFGALLNAGRPLQLSVFVVLMAQDFGDTPRSNPVPPITLPVTLHP
jgi:hypothetical protein